MRLLVALQPESHKNTNSTYLLVMLVFKHNLVMLMRETRFELAHPLRDKALNLAHLTTLPLPHYERVLLELSERLFKHAEIFFK